MCSSSPKAPSSPPPPAPPPPPPADDPVRMEAADASKSTQGDAVRAKKRGRSSLRIDLQTGTSGGTGLNVAQG